jgi:hypothetical protein
MVQMAHWFTAGADGGARRRSMKSIKVGWSRIVMAGVIALAVAAIAYIDAQSSVAGEVSATERQQAEAEIARTRAVTKLEAALGDAFGGVWFEPSTGQLHVGVTSPASRRNAEAVAEQAGVAGIVAETPVRSSWAQLEVAQERWARRLADLFDRAEAATSLRPKYNAIEVQLGSEVQASSRAEIEKEAAAEGANVLVEVSPREHLRVIEQARCNEFAANKAYCDPTIVAGVTIIHEDETTEPCTAGPVVLPVDRSTAAKATERLLLTAGHCIATGLKKWFSFNKKPTKLEIGAAGSYLNGHAGDIGVIKIDNPGSWSQAGFIPVVPTIAPWNKELPEPFPVLYEQDPTEGLETCISGQTSGRLCGKVLKVKQTFANASRIAEVNVTTKGGDSGAPWYSKTFAETSYGVVEGVHVGLNGGNAAFQELSGGLEALKKSKGLDLELLTLSNEERRHPVATAKKYPATISGKTAPSEELFTAFGTTVKCTESEFHGELTQISTSIEVQPTYKGCTGVGGIPVVATSNECKAKFTLKEEVAAGQFKAGVDVVCPGGKPGIQLLLYASHTTQTSGTVMCTVTVPPQTGLGTATLTNSGENIVVDKGTIEGVKVKIHRNGVCPSSGTENETAAGVFHNDAVTLSGTNEGSAVKIDIGGE